MADTLATNYCKENDLPTVEPPKLAVPKILPGQVAIVTGSSSGIGRAIAIALAAAGAKVAVNYAGGEQKAREVVGLIEGAGGTAIAVQADVSKENQVEAMFETTLSTWGNLDILVNNAGLQRDAAFVDLSLADWQRVLDVNLTGQFLCARAAVRAFKRQGIRPSVSAAAGKIICISSVHDVIPWAGHVNYAASKGGVMLMMKSIAQEVAPFRIRVNSICPGAVRTPINTEAWSTPEAYAELMKLVPYKRIGEPEDIGNVAVWLASDHSDYITGSNIYVDGGMTLYPGFETGG